MLAPDQLVDSCSPTHISSFARRQSQRRPLPRTLPMGRRSVHKFTYENVSKWYWRLLKCCTARAARTENRTGNPDEAPACLRCPAAIVDWNGMERTRHAHAATSVTHLSLNWTQLRLPPLQLRVQLQLRLQLQLRVGLVSVSVLYFDNEFACTRNCVLSLVNFD